ncbi:hypothetical protein [uncultured Corynebacterium sp.]|uniref:hypothetical protein n=1 Tax=uncultured Corynebacterium sp. TaxID=159447 RepID=UPI0025CCF316|nr:hypothetical protein [uncultured Corynebacterium sp.]
MKFFSRKALVASATAVAVAFGGASVASAQTPVASPSASAPTTSTEVSPTTVSNATTTEKTTERVTVTVSTKPSEEGSSISDMEPKEIRDWIAVFTAVIGALGTLLAFLSKYFDMPF